MSNGTRVLVLWESGCATYALRPGVPVRVGRHADCEIRVGLRGLSRYHARLCASPAGASELATIEDTGGVDGVRLGGLRIAPKVPVPVFAGDVIEIGGVVVVLHVPARGDAAPPGAVARAAAARTVVEDSPEEVDELVDVVALSELPVLLCGERGVGKSFTAARIHARSTRCNDPFVRVDCASIPEVLLDRRLFGNDASPGLLEKAAGGTVLLDELPAMPVALQGKLLDSMDEYSARFLAASTRDLAGCVAAGSLRRDLYERLNGIGIMIPALRERTAEIPGLALRFLAEAAARANRREPHRLSSEALGVLVRHPFPGNVGELRRTMDLAFELAGPRFIGPEHVRFEVTRGAASSASSATTRRFAPMSPTERPASPTEDIPIVSLRAAPPVQRLQPAPSEPPPAKRPRPTKKRS